MLRERVSENVYWFQSEVYAQVTAGVIAGPQWAVVIDTLATPEETLSMREYVEHELGLQIRYVINTHYHADHTWGNCFFPGATVVAHANCRKLMIEKGIPSLEAAKKQNNTLRQVKIVLPHLTFDDGELNLRVGKKNLILAPALGHSYDGISVFVEEDKILFAGDAFMPLPYVVDGNINDLTASIKKIGRMGLENIVQGHGDIILRGEIDAAVKENLAYLSAIRKAARAALKRKSPLEYLDEVTIEECGKSRVHLGGLAPALHQRNLRALYRHFLENKDNTMEEE
ncbi:MAG: MBL fold metallo-hydrolase [Anaerolineales bacterium]|nr:MBL fold metallo-hydrolase [Anaerolineales bacterium]MCX7756254.1 MBL fold metallo-hydrolase [Anaerolineales bacterium]MDW8277387.1 MBL fold metallo-hydrolase [Anaerolineales bacterium]